MYHRLNDPDPNPALFISNLQNANKNIFCFVFCLLTLFDAVEIKVFLTIFA
jgi:hypothetical protein